MFTQILVALDGSELSEKALPVARNRANSSDATIHLIQSVSRQPEFEAAHGGEASPQLAELSQDLARRLIETRQTSGQEYLDRVAAELTNAGLKVETAIQEGAADEQIISYSREHGVDLIVISTHGYGGVKRLLLGSVTDRVIRSCEVPVLVLPCS
jgi:nucleotide-binding universal stress UspA family protein